MFYLLIVLFAGTLIYISIAERFRSYAKLIAVQGILLFAIAIYELKEINLANLIFVSAETLIFKAILVPYFLFRIINQTKVYKVHARAFPSFYALLFSIAGFFVSIVLSNVLKNPGLDGVYMTIALFTLYTGVLLIITHRRIFSHMIGFLVVENAVFFFSLAIGSEMPKKSST